jgi:SprT protein
VAKLRIILGLTGCDRNLPCTFCDTHRSDNYVPYIGIFIIFDADNKRFSMRPTENEVLGSYLPAEAVAPVGDLLTKNSVRLVITRSRLSKLGDFRPGNAKRPHSISINGSLNKYEFLLVFLHELSHLYVFKRYGIRIKPHGKEWKSQYGSILREAVEAGLFHSSLEEELTAYSHRVKASGLADVALSRALSRFDEEDALPGWHFLEELPRDVKFQTKNGRTFVKEDKIRTRYRCLCLDNKRRYLVNPLVRVRPVQAGSRRDYP